MQEYEIEKKDIFNLNELLKDSDQEITKMAEKELVEKKNSLKFLEQELLKLLIPKILTTLKNSILEIRAGTGGMKHLLFAADLLSMYQNFLP